MKSILNLQREDHEAQSSNLAQNTTTDADQAEDIDMLTFRDEMKL